jgi:peptidoglycan/LPS O-acetylase OafA/YrhL
LYISRVFRILPLAWIAIVAVFLIAIVKGWPSLDLSILSMARTVALWFSFLALPDIGGFQNTRRIIAGVTWSLRFEWLFYLSLPFLALLFALFQRVVSNLTIIAIFLINSLFMFAMFPQVGMKIAAYIPLFLIGMLAAELSNVPRLVVALRSTLASLIGLAALLFELTWFHGSYGIIQYIFLSIFFVTVVSGNSYFGFLIHRSSVTLGEISYSIYLLHPFVLYFVMTSSFGIKLAGESATSLWLCSPVVVVLVLLLSLLSHKFIETPGINFGKRFSQILETRRRNNALVQT